MLAAEDGVDVDVEIGMLGQQLELRSSTFRLFFETSSGFTLSMLICR